MSVSLSHSADKVSGYAELQIVEKIDSDMFVLMNFEKLAKWTKR